VGFLDSWTTVSFSGSSEYERSCCGDVWGFSDLLKLGTNRPLTCMVIIYSFDQFGCYTFFAPCRTDAERRPATDSISILCSYGVCFRDGRTTMKWSIVLYKMFRMFQLCQVLRSWKFEACLLTECFYSVTHLHRTRFACKHRARCVTREAEEPWSNSTVFVAIMLVAENCKLQSWIMFMTVGHLVQYLLEETCRDIHAYTNSMLLSFIPFKDSCAQLKGLLPYSP
jgi:hypothetical protein